MASSERRHLAAVVALATLAALWTAACREFPVDPTPSLALLPDAWPAELAVTDTVVLAVDARLDGEESLRSLPIRWTSSDPLILSIVPLPAPDTAAAARGLGSTRARAVALRRGTAEVTAEVPEANGLPATEVSAVVEVSERWISLSAGWDHTCGVTVGREAYCWGKVSGAAFLGDGSSAGSATPVQVVGGLPFVAVSAGADHSCAARPDGLLFCWGVNARGALGSGTTNDALAPTSLLLGPRFEDFRAGWDVTCGVSDIRTGVCWGDDRRGQLGSARTTDLCQGEPCSLRPVAVRAKLEDDLAALLRFQDIAPGRDYTCGVDMEGRAWCWGSNDRGGLGDGRVVSSDTAVAVAGEVRFRSVSTGWYHACGVAEDGAVHCWGTNLFGELGRAVAPETCEGLPCSRVPVPVEGLPAAAAVSVRDRNACALATDGTAWCWGLNDRHQLGAPSSDTCAGLPCSRTPLPVSGGLAFDELTVGRRYACGRARSGFAYCWGSGAEGNLGDGSLGGTRMEPRRVSDPAGP